MNPSPIGKVLSILARHRVRALLMGGQACILYGGAEFSRDVDLVIDADEGNLRRLRNALEEVHAEPVFLPPLEQEALLKGHACHFRSQLPAAQGLRIDVMSVMHGCEPFDKLWARRERLLLPEVGRANVLSLPDLVQAKKTQRDKDWPMIRRLIEADYHNRPSRPSRKRIEFWLRESRTPELLAELCRKHPRVAQQLADVRPAIRAALTADIDAVADALQREETSLRAADRRYWQPLREELSRWRSNRHRQ